jgi:hypothetical protein
MVREDETISHTRTQVQDEYFCLTQSRVEPSLQISMSSLDKIQ